MTQPDLSHLAHEVHTPITIERRAGAWAVKAFDDEVALVGALFFVPDLLPTLVDVSGPFTVTVEIPADEPAPNGRTGTVSFHSPSWNRLDLDMRAALGG